MESGVTVWKCEACGNAFPEGWAQPCFICGGRVGPQAVHVLFDEQAFDSLPCVLAHEYKRLADMWADGEVYGAYFQTKDVIETTLKYTVLTVCAWGAASGVEGREAGYEQLLTAKALSLGDWGAILQRIAAFYRQPQFREKGSGMPAPLFTMVREVLDWMNRNRLALWRNAKIGHGALGFKEDAAYREDVRGKIACITKLYRDKRDVFARQTILSDGQPLTGAGAARRLDAQRGSLSLRVEEEGEIPLSPYILHVQHGVYFYDELESGRRVKLLSYPQGVSSLCDEEPVNAHYVRLARELRRSGVNLERAVGADFLTAQEGEFLDRLGTEGFVTPDHLVGLLQDALAAHDRGVFLLKMERGCGKSAFCEKLNRLYRKPLVLADDLDVRTVHITQTGSARAFCRSVEYQMESAYGEAGQTHMYRALRLEDFAEDADGHARTNAQALALYLDAWREETVRSETRGCRSRLMLVVDGLDEIRDDAIYSYLPAPEQLGEGVYLLLTSREPQEEDDLPDAFGERLDALHLTQSWSVLAGSEGNRAFLRAYIASAAPQCGGEDAQRLITLAEGRVLYLTMLCRLYADDKARAGFASEEGVVAQYVTALERRYGVARRERLHRLLCLLCSYGRREPLSLQEMADVLTPVTELRSPFGAVRYGGAATLDMAAMLSDTAPLLAVERGFEADGRRFEGENRYRPINENVASAVLAYLGERVSEAVYETAVCAVLRAQAGEPVTEGQKVVLAHAMDVINAHAPQKRSRYATEENLAALLGYSAEADLQQTHLLVMERQAALSSQMVAIGEHLSRSGMMKDRNLLAKAYFHAAKAYYLMDRNREALELDEKNLRLCERMDRDGTLEDRDMLAKAYMNYALSLQPEGKRAEAIGFLERSISIREELDASGLLRNRNSLAMSYQNYASALSRGGRREEALAVYRRSIALREALDAAGELPDRGFLAGSYRTCASLLDDMERFDEAVPLYERAVAILEEMDRRGVLMNRNQLAIAYNNYAYMLGRMGRADEEKRLYERCVQLREELDREGRLVDRDDLAQTYVNLASQYEAEGRLEDAAAMYASAVRIREELLCSGKAKDGQALAVDLGYYADILRQLGRVQEAEAMYARCIPMLDELLRTGRLKKRSVMAYACGNYARVLKGLGQKQKALAMYARCLELYEALVGEGQSGYRGDLAMYGTRYADLLDDCGQTGKAIGLYRRTLALFEELKDEGMLDDEDALAVVCNNFGAALSGVGRKQEAVQMFLRCVEIRSRLLAGERTDILENMIRGGCYAADDLISLGDAGGAAALCEKVFMQVEDTDAAARKACAGQIVRLCRFWALAHEACGSARLMREAIMRGYDAAQSLGCSGDETSKLDALYQRCDKLLRAAQSVKAKYADDFGDAKNDGNLYKF